MIKKLKQRRQLSPIRSESRSEHRRVGRLIYLALLLLLFGWLFNVFLGGLFWLKAEGMVLRHSSEIGVQYLGAVTDLQVREGDDVEQGESLAKVRSQQVLGQLASLYSDYSEVLTQLTELRIQQEVNSSLLSSAKERSQTASGIWQSFQSLEDRGIASRSQVLGAFGEHYDSLQNLNQIQAELQIFNREQERLESALQKTADAIKALESDYADGVLQAPVTGVVGNLSVRDGSVVRAGDPLLTIYSGRLFILAYLPTGGIHKVTVGSEVEIKLGLQTYPGEVARIWPVAVELPPEFQKSFAPRSRGQLAEIRLTEQSDLPLFSKVSISGSGWLPW